MYLTDCLVRIVVNISNAEIRHSQEVFLLFELKKHINHNKQDIHRDFRLLNDVRNLTQTPDYVSNFFPEHVTALKCLLTDDFWKNDKTYLLRTNAVYD